MNGDRSSSNPQSKSRFYFLIGFLFLLIMGITWSLDSFFVYSSLGIAVFFFFLAVWNRTPTQRSQQQQRQQHYNKGQQGRPQSPDPFLEFFKAFFTGSKSQTVNPADEGKRTAIKILAIVGTVFLVIFIPIILSIGDEENYVDNFQKAEDARISQSYDSSIYYYRKVVADDADNIEAWNGLGIGKLNINQYDSAIYFFNKAVELDDEYRYARYNKALTYYYKKDYRRSVSEAKSVLDDFPDYYDAMEVTGNNYYDQQRYDSAMYWYDQGYSNGLRSAWLCHVLAYLKDQKGETAKAIALYRETLQYDNSKVEVYERLGELVSGDEGKGYKEKAAQLKSSR